mgnify:CR=1 FL=1
MANIKFSGFPSVTDFTELVGLQFSDNGRITKADLRTALGIEAAESAITNLESAVSDITAQDNQGYIGVLSPFYFDGAATSTAR